MRLQRFGSWATGALLWGANCARCDAYEDSADGDRHDDFIAYLQRQGWGEDAKGNPLCPKCAAAKGEIGSE